MHEVSDNKTHASCITSISQYCLTMFYQCIWLSPPSAPWQVSVAALSSSNLQGERKYKAFSYDNMAQQSTLEE